MTFQSNQSGFTECAQPEFELDVETVDFLNREHKSLASFRKRIFDFTLAGLAFIFTLPMLLIVAGLIKFHDGGQVLFSQKRVGVNGKLFKCYKFRSMVSDAQERLDHLLETDPDARAEWESTQKLRCDPRITRLGSFLRKSSLDELPQLWNIVRGDMSIVGPRPIVENEIAKYGPYFEEYAAVRPGLTGRWQVSGRSETTYQQRVEHDAAYVQNWSFWSDVWIVMRTVPAILMSKGAV